MTTTTKHVALPTAVEEFLHRIGTADWAGMEDQLTAGVLYDASVPGWHYQYKGAEQVVREYREEWNGKYRWTVVERHVISNADAVALLIEMHGTPIRPGEHPRVVCRLSNLFRLEGDRIAEHRYTCCGEWDPDTVRHIAEHAPKINEVEG
jgi:hypothetical protein